LAHHFVPYEYWLACVPKMEDEYLPCADTYVKKAGGKVVAFVSLVGDRVAALFVDPRSQSQRHAGLLSFAQ